MCKNFKKCNSVLFWDFESHQMKIIKNNERGIIGNYLKLISPTAFVSQAFTFLSQFTEIRQKQGVDYPFKQIGMIPNPTSIFKPHPTGL